MSIERFLAQAREELVRVSPAEAAAAVERGALLVDIRPESNRREEGEIDGAAIIERIHLEWRLDPVGSHRINGFDAGTEVIVFCNEGYASSLAARDLRRIGLGNATDLIGGYRAWREADLPTRHAAR